MAHFDINEFFARRDKDWQNHDEDALAAGHSEEGEIVSPLFGTIRGYSAIQESYIEFYKIFPDAKYETEHLLIDGERAAQFIMMSGTQEKEFCGFPPARKTFQFRLASLFFFSNGKIDREIRIYDFTGMLMQLGALKAKPTY
jgi:predicted ester cyclase